MAYIIKVEKSRFLIEGTGSLIMCSSILKNAQVFKNLDDLCAYTDKLNKRVQKKLTARPLVIERMRNVLLGQKEQNP